MKMTSKPVIALVGFCAWIGVLIGFAIALYQPSAWWLTRDWVPVNAKINVVQIDRFGSAFSGTWNRLAVSYTYEVDSTNYMGHRGLFGLQESPAGLEMKKTFLKTEGTEAQILISPLQPDNSLMSRQIVWAEVLFGLAVALASLAVIWVMSFLRAQSSAPRQDQPLSAELLAMSAYQAPGQVPDWQFALPWRSMIKLAVVLGLAFLISSHFAWSHLDNSGSPYEEAQSAEIAGQARPSNNRNPAQAEETVMDAVKPAPTNK